MTEYAPDLGGLSDELDTPTLILDLTIFETNLNTIHMFFRDRTAKVRSVTKSHKCSGIAQRQMTIEGAVAGGICCAKVSEAEVMADAGASQIRMIEQVVGIGKIDRLLALARRRRICALVDDPGNVNALSAAAMAHGTNLDVLVEVDIGVHRCGVGPGRPALELARHITRSPNLRFVGLAGHDRASGIPNTPERAARIRQRLQLLLDTREQVERSGMPIEICAGGSTGSWKLAGTMHGITEVSTGSYALMDYYPENASPSPEFKPALRVLSTVISRPARDRAVIDCGNRALGFGSTGGGEMPIVVSPKGAVITQLYTEHGVLELNDNARRLRPGDKVLVIPRNHGAATLAYPHFVCVRNGKVESIWGIDGRDAHH